MEIGPGVAQNFKIRSLKEIDGVEVGEWLKGESDFVAICTICATNPNFGNSGFTQERTKFHKNNVLLVYWKPCVEFSAPILLECEMFFKLSV